jgi:UTP--glucose-1-phosphate uridylyltransferase
MVSPPTVSNRIQKVVIPAAGLGTRFLPATKVVPKEMMPIAGRPLIQFAVEEAAASGLKTVILVISRGKSLVAEHFSRNVALEKILVQRGRMGDANLIRCLSEVAEIQTVSQEAPLGLADAIRSARSLVGDEPFAVILPDAVIDSAKPCIRQLMDCYEKHRGCVVATQMVEASEVDRFGVLDVASLLDTCCGGRTVQVTSLTERPKLGSVSSRNGIFGRYILEPEIFSCIEQAHPGFGGELQLTDALLLYSNRSPLYAYQFEGTHYDAGSKLGYLQATLAYALKDPDVAQSLQEHMRSLAPSLGVTAH